LEFPTFLLNNAGPVVVSRKGSEFPVVERPA